MSSKSLYRYTAKGEGIFSAGKRLLPTALVDEAWENRKWLPRPQLPEGNYRFFLTEKGKETYEATLLHTHQKYLEDIHCESFDPDALGEAIYQDDWQAVFANPPGSGQAQPGTASA